MKLKRDGTDIGKGERKKRERKKEMTRGRGRKGNDWKNKFYGSNTNEYEKGGNLYRKILLN